MKPTPETYGELQAAYELFNARLFESKLPDCLITLQREKRSYGYFSAERFQRADGTTTDEIAMNPRYFAVVPLVEIMQTVVHEMAHLWQHHFGKPGRARYHNAEWGAKMEEIGLMPSSTGKPGGKRTGDCMADYPIEGGRFLQACEALLTQRFRISWYDRFPVKTVSQHDPESGGVGANISTELLAVAGGENSLVVCPPQVLGENKSNRKKYTCNCKINVWGKPGLKLVCETCNSRFQENL